MEKRHGREKLELSRATPNLSRVARASASPSMPSSRRSTAGGANAAVGGGRGKCIPSRSTIGRKRSSVGISSELQATEVVSRPLLGTRTASAGAGAGAGVGSQSGGDARKAQAREAMGTRTVAAKLQKLKDIILGVPPVSHAAQLQTLAKVLEECTWERVFGTRFGVLPCVPQAHKETLEIDGQALSSLPQNLRNHFHTVWVEGDGNSFWRALAVGLWKSQYYHVHLKLFVLAMSAKKRGEFVSDERLLHKMITLGGSVSGNFYLTSGGIRTPQDVANYERMLLEAIGYHCGDLRHTGRLMACLTCEALAMTVKLVNPTDLARYLKPLSSVGGVQDSTAEAAEGEGDNRHSALCVPLRRLETSRWCMSSRNGGDDFSPYEMAMVMTKYNPSRRRALECSEWDENESDGPTLEKDLHLSSLNHFATLVDVGWRGLPFPLDVAAPPLNPTHAGQVLDHATMELMEWEQRKINELREQLRRRLSVVVGGAGVGPWNRSPSRGMQTTRAEACLPAPGKAGANKEAPGEKGRSAPPVCQHGPRLLDEDLPGLVKVWTGRIQKMSVVRSYSISRSLSTGENDDSEGIAVESDQILGFLRRSDVGLGLLSSNPPPSAQDAPLRREEDYVAGHLSSGFHFWSNVVLENHRKRETLLGWLQGVSVSDFVEPTAAGVHEGQRYSGAELTGIELPNRVALEHQAWVDGEVKSLLDRGILARWEDVADIGACPRPVMSLPLTVDETEGPRLVWDGRWLNLMCRQPKVQAGGVTEVAQLSWPGAHQVTIALEKGMEHIPLNPDSWKYFGLKWKGVYYIWTVLCSGWCSSAYVLHTLSEAVILYLRSKDIPALACMDELWVATVASERQHPPEKQAVGAGVAAYVALAVLYHCGYFVARAKCHLVPSTRVLFLGVTCDTARCRFEVPEDRLAEMAEMEASLTRASCGGAGAVEQ